MLRVWITQKDSTSLASKDGEGGICDRSEGIVGRMKARVWLPPLPRESGEQMIDRA